MSTRGVDTRNSIQLQRPAANLSRFPKGVFCAGRQIASALCSSVSDLRNAKLHFNPLKTKRICFM
jgi:hypothetical protein